MVYLLQTGKSITLAGFFYKILEMKRFFTIAVIIIATGFNISAQTQTRLELGRSSSLTITGSTNISKFRLVLSGDKFPGSEYVFLANQILNRITISQNKLALEVKNFTSGNKMALNGFFKLIKSESYPFLSIQLNSLELLPVAPDSNSVQGKASVNITITGVTKQYSMLFSARLENGIQCADSKMKISIRDFGLVPPVEMMGLVKTSEWIEIDLHIAAKISF